MLLLIKLENDLAIFKTNKISKNTENSYNNINVTVGGGKGKNYPGNLHLTTYLLLIWWADTWLQFAVHIGGEMWEGFAWGRLANIVEP